MTGWMWAAWGVMAGVAGVYGWSWKRAGTRRRKWLEWGLTALVAGVSLSSMLMHEPWADELHTWLQARELTVGELWREMAYEGHFLPWHLILHPFARLGAPVETMGWLSWAINAAAVAWFVRKAPLGGGAKAAVGLSCVFLYLNPVISRCYVLVPLALCGVAALWWKRDERSLAFGLWVALLANTHVCMAGTAGMVFLVYAWENVVRRKGGRSRRECRRQWAGLGAMAAGGAVALAQILPSLWKSSVGLGVGFSEGIAKLAYFCIGCNGWPGVVAMLAGLVGLGVAAWRRDKGVFWVYAGSLAYLVGFAVFVYPAHILNRALLWWPVAVWAAWAAGKKGEGRIGWAVAAMGLGLMRPDMTWEDWRMEFDALPGACRYIAERHGRDAETWIEGNNYFSEGAAIYLDNVWDWNTGKRADRISWKAGENEVGGRTFMDCRDGIFEAHPEKNCVFVCMVLNEGRRADIQALARFGVDVEYMMPASLSGTSALVARVRRGTDEERMSFWMLKGRERLAEGNRAGAVEAWERAVAEGGDQWGMMNNLAWVLLEEGRVAEAREWMNRAMAHEEARESAQVWDTEAATRRAEGNEEGARMAERRRDELRDIQDSEGARRE